MPGRRRTHLNLEASRLARLLQLFAQGIADELNNLLLVLKSDFSLRRVYVDVDLGWTDFEGEVHERVGAFCQEDAVEAFEGSLEGGAVNESVCLRNKNELRSQRRGHGDPRLMKKRYVPFFAP